MTGKVLPSMALWNLIIAIRFVFFFFVALKHGSTGDKRVKNNLSGKCGSAWKRGFTYLRILIRRPPTASGRTDSCFEHSLSWSCRESAVPGGSHTQASSCWARTATEPVESWRED